MEKDDDGTAISRVIKSRREKEVRVQIAFWRLFINVSGRGTQEFLVTRFSDHQRLSKGIHKASKRQRVLLLKNVFPKHRLLVHSFRMQRVILLFFALVQVSSAQNNDGQLVNQLRSLYDGWRAAVIRKDAKTWQRYTAQHRQIEIRNRLMSERKAFPQGFFGNLPASPPSLAGLKALRVRINGPTVKSVYYGKVDFGIGGQPIDSLWTISYVKERSGWKYDSSEFVNISALPDIKKQLDAGNYQYVDQNDFKPSGIIPPSAPIQLVAPVKYITQVYVFCPGRQVDLTINGVSKHRFQHAKEAQIVIGGARDGKNEVQFKTSLLKGGDSKSVMTIRVYLMSQVKGKKPVKVFEYQVEDGKQPLASGVKSFTITPEIANKLK